MKKLPSVKLIALALTVIGCLEFLVNRLEDVILVTFESGITTSGNFLYETILMKNQKNELNSQEKVENIEQQIEVISLKATTPEPIVYDGMTMTELTNKLNLSLHSDLEGYGSSFAEYSVEYGVDPYLAVSITLLETGCKWNCSALVTKCNNVGGMKGPGRCNGGYYDTFESLDAGIEAMIKNLSKNYIQKGLVTPEQINTKYAESTTWATKVNKYIEELKNAV